MSHRARTFSSSLESLSVERRRRVLSRAVPLLVALAAASLGVGLIVGGVTDSGSERTAKRFVRAWEHEDYATMYALVDTGTRGRASLGAFRAAYDRARSTATATSFRAGKSQTHGDTIAFPMTVRTRVFGIVRTEIRIRVSNERVQWDRSLVFPGLRRGERLTRRTRAPARAAIAARDGTVIAGGPATARTQPLGPVSTSIAGTVGPPDTEPDRDSLRARGFPPGTPIGKSGLERIAERQVAGTPGGQLLAGSRALATTEPRAASAIRTTIDVGVQRAAVQALGGRFGGIAALDARTGEVRALAGIAFSAPQPPGSTFKIITATAALEQKLVKPSTPFPVETKAVIEGVDLANANGESCGGTFIQSFAKSCNSVFAPLGAKLGGAKLVAAAERFGFNSPPALPGAQPSTIPAASAIGGPLAVGSSAIGQGKVQATPLQMASVAQTIASKGLRRPPTLIAGDAPAPAIRVTPARIARTVARLMIAVVQSGTGVAAAIPGVTVAGKTGTAELRDTTAPPLGSTGATGSNTDAWFAAYAPAKKPKLAVGVLFVKAGAGGQTAAPAAKIVLTAGLK